MDDIKPGHRVLSLFSGVGGMDLGLERAGHTIVAMCEIDKHARGVLAHHWPLIPLHNDVTTLDGKQYYGSIDLVSGGSPCQDLSVAGRRKGLDGARSGLFWHQCRIADECAAPWILWENVAGALTSSNGADFAAVLWGITGAHPRVPDGGWRSAGVIVGPKRWAVWRLLDAQWFGVAQRRKRVFVVGGPRSDCRPEILFESEGMRGDNPPSRTPGQEVAGTIGTRPQRGDLDSHGAYIVDPLLARDYKGVNSDGCEAKLIVTFVKAIRSGPRDTDGNLPPEVWKPDHTSPTLSAFDNNSESRATVLAFEPTDDVFSGGNLNGWRQGFDTLRAAGGDLAGGSESLVVTNIHENQRGEVTLNQVSSTDPSRSPQSSEITQQVEAVHSAGNGVRRLTPIECERLMGWPDNWTAQTVTGKQADSHRYRQAGNGVVANVAYWIGRRLVELKASR